jgi:predicted alpha-1,6-mannanase (GH76 family)
MFSSSFIPLLLGVALIPNVSAQFIPDQNNVTQHRERFQLALFTLQTWYNSSTGLWDTTGWWNAANIMTMIGNYAQTDPTNMEAQEFARNIFDTAFSHASAMNPQPGIESWVYGIPYNATAFETGYTKLLNPTTNEPHTVMPPNWPSTLRPAIGLRSVYDWLDGYYDDDLWWALAWIKAFDVTSNSTYLYLAQDIFDHVARQWGTHCFDGGLYWSYKKDYINAVTNELFISTAAHLAHRYVYLDRPTCIVYVDIPNPYLWWAQTSLAWFLRSGLINEDNTINSGLNERCETNGTTTWIFDQGVILGGLMELHRHALADTRDNYAKFDGSYLELAAELTTAPIPYGMHGVLRDKCETSCGADTAQAEGIYMRNLATMNRWLDWDHDYDVKRSVSSITWWAYSMRSKAIKYVEGGLMFGACWESYDWPMNATTQSSAMDALLAAWSLQVE